MIQGESFLTLATTLPRIEAFQDLVAALDTLDDHLAFRTFFAGPDVSYVDWVVWGAIKGWSDLLSAVQF